MQTGIWNYLFDNGFMPHGYCLLWDPGLFWSHAVADAVIAIAYFSIPIVVVTFALRRKDFEFRWVLHLFGAFIVCCGLTHLFGIWTLWVPSYTAEAGMKVITAMVSFATAIMIWPLLPKVLALPSTRDLEVANAMLEQQNHQREEAQAALAHLNRELEARVQQRTEDLERKNDELARAISEARDANESKDRFLSMMSHEIRTPLHGVLSMSDLLLETGLTPEQRDYTRTIVDSSQSLLSIVNDILDFSKAQAGHLTISPEPADVAAICEDVVQSIAPLAHDQALEIACTIAPDFPAAVDVDPQRLRQIITNLVGNAVRYTDYGWIEVVVDADPSAAADGLRITVKDTGTGIPEADLETIFEQFTQLQDEGARGDRGGTGLGLAISRRIAELMDGRITVESEVGVGSTFTLRLPLRNPIAAGAPPRLDRTVVLVAPDGPNLRSLQATLQAMHAQVRAVDIDTDEPLPECDTVVAIAPPDLPDFDDADRVADHPGRLVQLRALGTLASPESEPKRTGVAPVVVSHYPIRRRDVFDLVAGPELRQSKLAAEPAAAGSLQSRLRILVVDDSEENRLVASRILEKAEQTVFTCSSGAEALSLLKDEPVDLILLDLRMPGMSGYETAEAIRKMEAGGTATPIIAVSANVMPEIEDRIWAAGMNGQLSKPFRPEQLRDLVRGLVADPTRQPKTVERPVLDESLLREILENTSERVLVETIAGFLSRLEERRAAIAEATDPKAIEDFAHSLAGSAGVVGLVRLTELCRTLERRAVAGDASAIRTLRPRILEAIEEGRRRLDHYLETTNRGGRA